MAQTIRQTVASAQEGETIADLDGDGIEEAKEGRVITALHVGHERSSALVKAKKRKALATFGKLACEACGFDFRERYGGRGEGFIKCHHVKPVHALKPGDNTKIGDLRLLCSNCDRMVHAKRQWLTVERRAAILRQPAEVQRGRDWTLERRGVRVRPMGVGRDDRSLCAQARRGPGMAA